MNEIHKFVIRIELDQWEPFNKELQREIDELLGDIRAKKILHHAGNVKTFLNEDKSEKV